MSLPTKEQIEDYIDSAEEFLSSSLTAVTPDLPGIADAVHRLWLDVSRFGPPLPDLHIPGLGTYQVPPPPPPPPPTVESFWWSHLSEWACRNPRLAGGIGVGTIGAGLLVGYSAGLFMKRRGRSGTVRASSVNTRRRVVVVLGGDTPLGLPLITALELDGYIVIASVSTPEAVGELEKHCNGFVRALVFNPQEPAMMAYFLRSLQATLSLRFPINVPGDPYNASPATSPYVHSVVSLLTLPGTTPLSIPAPFERLTLTGAYHSHLTRTHIAPLQAIQAMLPLLRVSHARARDSGGGSRTIVVCVPAQDARVGVPFAAAQAMSAAATVRGVEVLRREIRAAASAGGSQGAVAMRDLRAVIVDVGSVAVGDRGDVGVSAAAGGEHMQVGGDVERSMMEWTASERAAYSDAFAYVLQQVRGEAPRRRPEDVRVFVNAVTSVIGGGRAHHDGTSFLGLQSWSWGGRLRNWIRGDRFSVGAGARTYTIASYLPSRVLDAILVIPELLVSVRNALLMLPSRGVTHSLAPVPPPPPRMQKSRLELDADRAAGGFEAEGEDDAEWTPDPESARSRAGEAARSGESVVKEVDVGAEAGTHGDDGDGESSGVGEGSEVGSSWVSLQEQRP